MHFSRFTTVPNRQRTDRFLPAKRDTPPLWGPMHPMQAGEQCYVVNFKLAVKECLRVHLHVLE